MDWGGLIFYLAAFVFCAESLVDATGSQLCATGTERMSISRERVAAKDFIPVNEEIKVISTMAIIRTNYN